MRRQQVAREMYPVGVQDQMSALTARPSHVLAPKESLQKYLGRMPAGGKLYIPEGTWQFTADLTLALPDVHIEGSGWRTILQFAGDAVCRISATRCSLRRLQIKASAVAPRTTYAAVTVTGSLAILEEVWVSQCYHGILVSTGGDHAVLDKCRVTGRAGGGTGLACTADHCSIFKNYIPDEGGGALEINVTGTSNAVHGNHAPGGAITIVAGNSNVGNYT